MANELIRDSTGRLVVNPDYHPQYKAYNEITSQTPYNIQRSIDLAKLKELTAAPGFEERKINLAERGLETTQAQNVAEQKHWADLLGLDQNKLQETAREHNSALSELTDYHKGVLHNQLTDSFMAHLAPLYAGNPEIIQNVLKNRGLPELSAAAQLLVDKQNKVAGETALTNYNLSKTSGKGDPNAVITDLKLRNPDAYDLIKDRVSTSSTAPTKPKVNFAQLLAKGVKYGTGPGLLFGAGQAATGLDLTGVRKQLTKSFLDFHNALMQRE